MEEEEGVGIGHDVGGRAHPKEDVTAQQCGDCGEAQGDDGGQAQRAGNMAAHDGVVVCAKGLCNRDGKASACTIAETHDEKHDSPRRSNSRQCSHAKKPPHDDGIDNGVKLLEEVAANQRQCEEQDAPCGASHRHVARGSHHVVCKRRRMSSTFIPRLMEKVSL